MVVAECKNWLKDVRLTPERFDVKIARKYGNFAKFTARLTERPNVVRALYPIRFLRGFDGKLLQEALAVGKENFVPTKLLVLTDHVKFTRETELSSVRNASEVRNATDFFGYCIPGCLMLSGLR